jgi:signal peptidase I
MKRRSLTGLIAGALSLALLAAGWLFLGPTQVGGTTSYAVVYGNSMEPMLERGDLAVIREQSSYRPGDVVLYDSPQLRSKVLHRIVRVEDDRFVLKGDNNDFLDNERPTEEQIVGRLWLSVPAAGKVSEWLREPVHSALLVGFATLLALGGGAGVGAVRRRRRASSGAGDGPREPRAPNGVADPQPLLVGIGVALAAFSLLALLAFTRPTTVVETVSDAYAHEGRFAYAGDVRRNAVYPDGRVSTGEPIFLRLVPQLRVSFRYRLDSRLPSQTAGNVRLGVRVSDGRGWERTLSLAAARPFAGGSATIAGTLDLRRIQALIDQVRELTGSGQTAYSVTVIPRVTVKGSVGGEPVDAVFAPALPFDLGDLRLQPKLGASGEGLSPYAPREPGAGIQATANTLELGAISLPVSTARRLAVIGLVASVLLGLLVLALLLQRFRGEEHSRIAARYGHLLLPVVTRSQEWTRVTELADMESLVRLAQHHDRMILHVVDEPEHVYVVEEGGSVYRYRTGGRPPAQAPLPLPPRPPVAPRSPDDPSPTAVGAGNREGPRRRFGRRRSHDDW